MLRNFMHFFNLATGASPHRACPLSFCPLSPVLSKPLSYVLCPNDPMAILRGCCDVC